MAVAVVVEMHHFLAIGQWLLIIFGGVANLGRCLNLRYYLIVLSHAPFLIKHPHLIG